MTTKGHDFTANPLSVSTLINLSVWVESVEDVLVANSVLKRDLRESAANSTAAWNGS